eukprot:TRINITY_DN33739_c0_g1_i1.p1 TRINITY_DN33739_c0_g1~~TRINITY_DN33739_c0_g1_i1.p1  ORF type:complete len:177 (+),score=27.91 TRINITY_DN33739_c0_g1_i1:66-596(+)
MASDSSASTWLPSEACFRCSTADATGYFHCWCRHGIYALCASCDQNCPHCGRSMLKHASSVYSQTTANSVINDVAETWEENCGSQWSDVEQWAIPTTCVLSASPEVLGAFGPGTDHWYRFAALERRVQRLEFQNYECILIEIERWKEAATYWHEQYLMLASSVSTSAQESSNHANF